MYGRKLLKKQSCRAKRRSKSKRIVRKPAESKKRKCESETNGCLQNVTKSELPAHEAEPPILWDLINFELLLEKYHEGTHMTMDPTLISHLKDLRDSALLDEDIQLEHVEVFQTGQEAIASLSMA